MRRFRASSLVAIVASVSDIFCLVSDKPKKAAKKKKKKATPSAIEPLGLYHYDGSKAPGLTYLL